MKPIETGCKAIIIKGEFAGKEFDVGLFVGSVPGFSLKDNWEVTACDGIYNPEITHQHCSESFLMRIDDPDIQEEIESELVMVE